MHKYYRMASLTLSFALTTILSTGCQQFSNNTSPSDTPQSHVTTTAVAQERNTQFTSEDIIYFIMTDRFNDGSKDNNTFEDYNPKNQKAYQGGDFKGLTEKLDYIKSLGTTAIWITPIVKNQPYGYHGYWATDFETTDPHLGTQEEFKNFVDSAHKKGMKVLLDYVVNHTGEESPWLKMPEKNDWFHEKKDIVNWSDLKEVEDNWLLGLPDLNTENPEVLTYFISNANWWIDQTGIDGMRLDTVRHVPKHFWESFVASIKKQHPEFYFIGEVWSDNVRYMQLYNDAGIDGLTNYNLYNGITGTFKASGSSSSLYNAINKDKFFKMPKQNGIFIDNHDNPRFSTSYGSIYTQQALTFIMTYPAIPIIYYGTEIGMEGKGDPDNRRFMAWDQVENNVSLDYYKKLLAIRNQHPELKQGHVETLKTSNDIVIYTVSKQNKGVIILMNLRKKTVSESVTLSESQTLKLSQMPLLNSHEKADVKMTNGKLTLSLLPQQILMIELEQ